MDNSAIWDTIQFGQCVQKKKQKMMFTPEDDPRMWNFVAENFLSYGPFEVFTKMKQALRYEHADKSLYYRFKNILAPNLHLTNFSIETKLLMAKKFNILLNEEFKQNLLQFMDLVFDSTGCIEDFSWKNQFLPSSIQTTSSDLMLSFARTSCEKKQKRKSTNSSEIISNGCKKIKTEPSEANQSASVYAESSAPFLDSLRDIISETVQASNRKLIDELKNSNVIETRKTPGITNTPQNNGMRMYLEGLKGLLDHFNLSELDDIRVRINSLERKILNEDAPLSINCIRSMLDHGLKMIGG